MTAKELKNLAVQVRRSDTALRQIAGRLELSDADKKALLKAATVLSGSGRKAEGLCTDRSLLWPAYPAWATGRWSRSR